MPLLSLLAAALAQAPQVPAVEGMRQIVAVVPERPGACRLASATRVALRDLLAAPGKWVDECVAVEGYPQGSALFVSPPRVRGADWRDPWQGRRLGLYGKPRVLAAAGRRGRTYVAVGVLGSCEAFREPGLMVMGYCHYSDGPYLAVAQMRRPEPRPHRRREAGASDQPRAGRARRP